MWLLLRVVAAAVLAWAAAVAIVFAVDHGDRPVHADAVVVLSGSPSRLPVGLRLVREGDAPLLLHLTRIDVVTSQFHVVRARMLITRCYHGALRMVGAPQEWWKLPWFAVTETVKLVYQVTVVRSC